MPALARSKEVDKLEKLYERIYEHGIENDKTIIRHADHLFEKNIESHLELVKKVISSSKIILPVKAPIVKYYNGISTILEHIKLLHYTHSKALPASFDFSDAINNIQSLMINDIKNGIKPALLLVVGAHSSPWQENPYMLEQYQSAYIISIDNGPPQNELFGANKDQLLYRIKDKFTKKQMADVKELINQIGTQSSIVLLDGIGVLTSLDVLEQLHQSTLDTTTLIRNVGASNQCCYKSLEGYDDIVIRTQIYGTDGFQLVNGGIKHKGADIEEQKIEMANTINKAIDAKKTTFTIPQSSGVTR